MDTVDNLILHLPRDTKHLFKKLCSTEDYRYDLKDIEEFIGHELSQHPYPTLQILKYHATLNHSDLSENVYAGLAEYLGDDQLQTREDLFNRFLNFIANFHTEDERMLDICDALLHKMKKFSSEQRLQCCLSMLARSTQKLLHLYMKVDSSQSPLTSKSAILFHTVEKKEHFVASLLEAESIPQSDLNTNCGHVLALIKLIQQLSTPTESLKNISLFSDDFLEKIKPPADETPRFLHSLYYDLRRIGNIFDMLTKHIKYELPLKSLIPTQSFLDLMFKQTKFTSMNFDIACDYIAKNHTYYGQMLGVKKPNRELDILVAYHVLATICDIYFKIRKDSNYTRIVDERLSIFADYIRSIEDCNVLIDSLQNVFALLFLRWETVTEIVGTEEPIGEVMFDVMRDTGRCGFVCNKFLLENILDVVQNVITDRLAITEMDECQKQSLHNLLSVIEDAHWRLNFLQRNQSDSSAGRDYLDFDIIPCLFAFHDELSEQRSSDDEPSDDAQTNASNTLTRKKPKLKKKRNSMTRRTISENYGQNLVKDGGASAVSRVVEDRGIISRMLANPMDLAMMALSRDEVEVAKGIIEKFDLKDTTLQRDISSLENMRYIRSQLQKAIARYEEQESYLKSHSTIEHIKKIAAIGFETSRITNIIEEFSRANQLVPDPENSACLEKHCSTFPFLRQYQNDRLQICIVLDLILSLNMNHELSSNLWNMTNRLYGADRFLEELGGQEELYRGVGSVPFFNNMVQCQFLFKMIGKENLGVREMLCNTFYTLRNGSLKSELERENIFKGLAKKTVMDVNTLTVLKGVGKSFDELKIKTNYYTRFSRYIVNAAKLLEIVNASPAENISQILAADMTRVIGEILFERQIAPADIESLVFSLNLNMVHTIALNVCPTVERRVRIAAEKPAKYEYRDEMICAYVSKYNQLLAYVLQEISGQNDDDISFMNSSYFKHVMELPEVKTLASIHDENVAIAVLLFDRLDAEQFENLDIKDKVIPIYMIAKEKFERSCSLSTLKDEAIKTIIQADISQIKLMENINDINIRVDIILENIIKIQDSKLATNFIKSTLLDDAAAAIDPAKKSRLERYLKDIKIFSEAAQDFLFRTWSGAYAYGEGSPELIMRKLIKLKKYELCCEWWELHNQSNSLPLAFFHDLFFEGLGQTKKQIDPHLLKILESFPDVEVVTFLETYIEKFKNLAVLKYAVEYLVERSSLDSDELTADITQVDTRISKYQNYRVSLCVLSHLKADELPANWDLISRPILLIEQFVMNSRFEVLSRILQCIRPYLEEVAYCKYCSDHTDMIYEIPMNSSITLGDPKNSAFILLNFNLYQNDHAITATCIDTLLQIYATKALDYRINETSSSNDPASLSTEMASLDSLYGAFIMPKEAPIKDDWIKDEEAVQCMCCKRAIFTMLTRRHHCRRCGRVVCSSCSLNRLRIPNLYEDIPVRVCNDCFRQIEIQRIRSMEEPSTSAAAFGETPERKKKWPQENYWQLSGNVTHDKLLREEFSYEHAPSTHLCLSILSFHSNNADYVNLLLHHCRKFEKLLRPVRQGYPNPEIDYALVARMLNCLALAAKVRGGPPECDIIRDHSEIIISAVQNGCESLLPVETLSNQSLRKLGDSMVLAEKWPLALEIYLKCGHSTGGVMAAYGLACLRVGRYETARDQLHHCMTRHCRPRDIANILQFITTEHELDMHSEIDIPTIKRPNRSPPLLDEIVKVIESTAKQTHVPETLARADSIRNSNTSLASIRSRPKEKIPIHEPAMNIINTLSNLKKISQGNYCDNPPTRKLDNKINVVRKTRMFEECMFYLLSHGSHADIVNFLIRHDQTMSALRYFILQNLDNEIFIRGIYVKHLKRGQVDVLIRQMTAIDSQLSIWKDAIIQTCRYLESKNLLNSLYHLQILLNDPIRASMTCVKFYSMNCNSFRELQNNSFHLINAQKHLQTELEMCQWENINLSKKRPVKEPSFLMQMDAKTLNCHINTILRQMEVTKFLAKAEQDDRGRRSARQILKQIGVENTTVPTLFDSLQERIQICILVLLCGNNIEEGFGLVYRIIQDYNIPSTKIYVTTAKYLARNNRLVELPNLINCIKSNNGVDNTDYDKILSLAVHAANNTHLPEIRTVLDELIKLITDVETKITCHIYVGQLKSAYLLAVQNNRLNDIMKILSQAEATNQVHIVRLCEKKLNINQR